MGVLIRPGGRHFESTAGEHTPPVTTMQFTKDKILKESHA